MIRFTLGVGYRKTVLRHIQLWKLQDKSQAWRTYDRLATDLTIILGQVLRYFVNLGPELTAI